MLVPAIIAFAVIPFGSEVSIFGKPVPLYIADLNVGLLYIVAVASIGIYGIILAGWSSNSKYPLLGGLRSSAQLISYEVAVTLTFVAVILASGTLSMVGIVEAQKANGVWFAFVQPVSLFIYFVGGLAETNRAPFDLPEAEQELVAGFHTEYSGMRFALFFLAEYANMIVVSAIATTLFFGGWLRPFPNVAFLGVPRPRAELDLVRHEDVPGALRVPVDPGDAPALPVRPADAARMEGPDPAGDREHPRDGRRESGAELLGKLWVEAIAFYTLAACILGFGVLVITAKNTVHSIMFLVVNFLFIAALYATLGAQFLAVIQVIVYAGGIVVLYLFVVMLVNLKRPPEAHKDRRRRGRLGLIFSLVVLAELVAISAYKFVSPTAAAGARRSPLGPRQRRADRDAAVHRLPRSLRARVDPAARGDDRGDRAGAARTLGAERMTPITPVHYMVLSAALFMIGVIGVMVRRNIIVILMSIELMLNAVNINLVAFSSLWQNAVGQVFVIFVICVAAAEAAVGLGIILAFYRNKETVNIDEMSLMRW